MRDHCQLEEGEHYVSKLHSSSSQSKVTQMGRRPLSLAQMLILCIQA